MSNNRIVLDIRQLTVTHADEPRPKLDQFSLTLAAGETAVVLGETGSGKEALLRAICAMPEPGETISGTIQLGEALSAPQFGRHKSGTRVAYLPGISDGVLSPHASVHSQLVRILARKLGSPRSSAKEELRLALERIEGAPSPAALRSHPSEIEPDALAFGFLACAAAQTPDLVLADHPLAQLSPTHARAVADALISEQKRLGFALLYAARGTLVTTWLSGRVLVMRAGKIVEEGPVSRLASPQAHAYTQTLYKAMPNPALDPAPRRAGRGEPILQVRGLQIPRPDKKRRGGEGITFDLRRGASLAFLGEDGSGRRALLRLALGLDKLENGRSIFDSVDIGILSGAMVTRLRRRIAFITGDDEALDRRMTVRDTVEEPLRAHLSITREHVAGHRDAALKRVGLTSLPINTAVASLSAFDRRRLQVARAIVTVPRLAVIEEPQRGLGPLEQSVMMDLLKEFRAQEDPAFLILTANFALAEALADEAIVFKDREVVERGAIADLLKAPKNAYTKSLIAAVMPASHEGLSHAPPRG